MIGWKKGHWPFRKGGEILPSPKPKRGTVSFEQMGKALQWLVKPWRKP